MRRLALLSLLVLAGCAEGIIGDADDEPASELQPDAPLPEQPWTAAPTQVGDGGAGGADGVYEGGAAPCPDDMVLAGATCMDRYEAPNMPGAEPLAMQTAHDGEEWCEARGKRLCSDVEWIAACEGQQQRLYPYGDDYEAHRCNDDKTWISPSWQTLGNWPSQAARDEAARLYQADPSGSRSNCRSEDGAFDLTGNVAEWVVRTLPNSNNYDHVMKGCYWSGCYGGSKPNCSFVNPAHPGGFRSYEAGFRCCLDAR